MPPSSTQLVMLRLDIFCGRVRGGCSGLGFFCGFFCGVLAHFAALCILVFMPLQRSQLSLSLWPDMLMSQELSPGFRVFLQPFLVAFFVHLEGDPFTAFVLRHGLA